MAMKKATPKNGRRKGSKRMKKAWKTRRAKAAMRARAARKGARKAKRAKKARKVPRRAPRRRVPITKDIREAAKSKKNVEYFVQLAVTALKRAQYSRAALGFEYASMHASELASQLRGIRSRIRGAMKGFRLNQP